MIILVNSKFLYLLLLLFLPLTCVKMDCVLAPAQMESLLRFLHVVATYHDKCGYSLSDFVLCMTHGTRFHCSEDHKSSILQAICMVKGLMIAIDHRRSMFFNSTDWECVAVDAANSSVHRRSIPKSLGVGFAGSLRVLDLCGCNITGCIPKSIGQLVRVSVLFILSHGTALSYT